VSPFQDDQDQDIQQALAHADYASMEPIAPPGPVAAGEAAALGKAKRGCPLSCENVKAHPWWAALAVAGSLACGKFVCVYFGATLLAGLFLWGAGDHSD
jgi:hypothetical protein